MELLTGTVVALIVQALKQYVNNEYATLGILLVVSIGAGALYQLLTATGDWGATVEILKNAAAIYAIFIARFEKS